MRIVNHIKVILSLLCALTIAALCACSAGENAVGETQPTAAQPATEYTLSPGRKVIIDTDTGADDAAALILAAKAPNITILGVTTLVGNVGIEQSTQNALAALEIAGCSAPVYRGSSENLMDETINAFSVFGTDGMGDADLIHPVGKAEEQDAIDFILETVAANPGEVEIISLGPATNIAKAIRRDPDTMKQVKRIWSMGTTGYGHGNASPVAEFNVYNDPESYQIMLNSGVEITVLGFDQCGGEAGWTGEQFDQLDQANEIGHFVSASFRKFRQFYTSNHSDRSDICDPLAMMCAVYDNFVTDTVRCHGSCITDDGETRGMVILYQEGFTYDVAKNDYHYNLTLITGVHQSDYFSLYLDTIGK
jgi:purine nucleosidase